MKRLKIYLLAFCAAVALTVPLARSVAASDECDSFIIDEDEGYGTRKVCVLVGEDDDWCYYSCVTTPLNLT